MEWISPTWAGNEMVGSLVSFVDGLPFKPGYRRYQIKSVAGIDDFAAIREVVTRRIKGLQERDEPFPDIWLIDGGKGQLSSALAAFESLKVVPPTVIALAKREEEIYVQGQVRADRLEPPLVRLAALAIRPRRGPPLRAALSSSAAEEADFGRRANVRLIQNLLPVQARLSSPQRENP